MLYRCSICGEVLTKGFSEFVNHTEKHIVEEIKKKHPDWAKKDGYCPKCLEYYRKQIKGEKSE